MDLFLNPSGLLQNLANLLQPDVCRGAALPTNTPGVPCIFDARGRAGICGDWLLGSSLESAALSGVALGNHVRTFRILLFKQLFIDCMLDHYHRNCWLIMV